jgi:hypothetical protein
MGSYTGQPFSGMVLDTTIQAGVVDIVLRTPHSVEGLMALATASFLVDREACVLHAKCPIATTSSLPSSLVC